MRIVLISIGLLIFATAYTQNAEEILASAEEAYRNGEYGIALENYQTLERPNSGWQILYNIGNCHYQLNSTASAILYFERALKLNPRSKVTRENLELAKSGIPDRVVAIQEFFLVRWLKAASKLIPLYLWGGVLLALFASLSFFLARAVKYDRFRTDRVLLASLVLAIVLAIGPSIYARQQYFSDDRGVVMYDSDVHVAPDSASQVSKTIGAGETVDILEEFNGLLKVRFVNYEVGWLSVQEVERI